MTQKNASLPNKSIFFQRSKPLKQQKVLRAAKKRQALRAARRKQKIFGAPRINEDAEAEAALQAEKEAKEQIAELADDERAKAIEDGTVSSEVDLWVSHEDGSLYKHSTCSIHNLTHLPKDPNCPVCARAKMLFAPARKMSKQSDMRQDSQKRIEAREPFDLVLMDLKIVRKGPKGKTHEASLNLLDANTGASRIYRLSKHDANAIRVCLMHFAVRRASYYVVRGHSDNAGEITKACDELGWISKPTAANRPVHNPFAEQNIQTVTMGAKCALLQSNLPNARFWAEAESHFTTALFFFSPSRCNPKITKSEALVGLHFEGRVFPFGCLMHYKPDPKKLPHTHSALTKPGLFLGWHLGAGHRWSRLYKVLDYEALLAGSFQVRTIREVTIHKCEPQVYHNPLVVARDKALETFDATDFPLLITELPALDQVSMIGATRSEQQQTPPLPKLKPPKPSKQPISHYQTFLPSSNLNQTPLILSSPHHQSLHHHLPRTHSLWCIMRQGLHRDPTTPQSRSQVPRNHRRT